MNNAKNKFGPEGIYRIDFDKNFRLEDPKDWGLGIPKSVPQEKIPAHFIELYSRFYSRGYIHSLGNKCVLMSQLLRRIMRLHGFEAHTRQVVFMYEHPERGWKLQMGGEDNFVGENMVDVHQVVVSGEWILDFSLNVLTRNYGLQTPLAMIGRNDTSTVFGPLQRFGTYGNATWIPRRPYNDYVRHLIYEHRNTELEYTEDYFNHYNMRPYIEDQYM